MPILTSSRSAFPIKLLFLGDSGTGKTGALASLAEAGYNLRVLDFDNGLDILASILRDKPEALSRVVYETCTDRLKTVGGKTIVDGIPSAWTKAMNLLDRWKILDKKSGEVGYDLGLLSSWGLRDILVIDSLTFMSDAAMRMILALNNRGTQRPWQSDWNEAQNLVEGALALLYADHVRCNVIVNAHVNYMDIMIDTGQKDSQGNPIKQVIDSKGLPQAVGQKLSLKIPRYFNTSLIATREGSGMGEKRWISTKSVGIVEAKTSIIQVPSRLPLATGLADYFKLLHGEVAKL